MGRLSLSAVLTPSFIFITGFLVSHVYLRRYAADSPVLRGRLLRRGLKLLALFVALNVVDTVIGSRTPAATCGAVAGQPSG